MTALIIIGCVIIYLLAKIADAPEKAAALAKAEHEEKAFKAQILRENLSDKDEYYPGGSSFAREHRREWVAEQQDRRPDADRVTLRREYDEMMEKDRERDRAELAALEREGF